MTSRTDDVHMNRRPVLEVHDLSVSFQTDEGPRRVLHEVGFDVYEGECLGIVGESGSGKSVSMLTVTGLLPDGLATIESGSARYDGIELLTAKDAVMRRIRGAGVSMVFQDPLTSLNPVLRVGDQIVEALRAHESRTSRSASAARAVELLELVGVPNPQARVRQYPHEFSGGMRQRVMIAMAIANDPRLIIADEPTTALDVTIQAQVMEVLSRARHETGAGLIMVTHDLGLVAEVADRVVVMKDGRVVERGTVKEIFAAPEDPYTRKLLDALPRIDDDAPDPKPQTAELLQISELHVEYPIRSGALNRVTGSVKAVAGVDLTLRRGETLGVVGESGCGKSTLAKAVLGLVPVTSGSIEYAGEELAGLSRREMRTRRRQLQILFQDPYSSLDPMMTVDDIVSEPLRVHGTPRLEIERRVGELLDAVGLAETHRYRYPHEFSGGQRQRIGLARSLALNPELIVLDEPVSALDVSIQAQVLDLLMELQRDLGLSYLMISHDLGVIRQVSDRIAVMYLGKVVEIGTNDEIFLRPRHPYTRALLSAVPVPDPELASVKERIVLSGDVPNPAKPPSGCVFRTRCWKATEVCGTMPPLTGDDAHRFACHHPEDAGLPVPDAVAQGGAS